jgi:hypothetical protein
MSVFLKDFIEAANNVPVMVYDTDTETWHEVKNVYIEDDKMVVEI